MPTTTFTPAEFTAFAADSLTASRLAAAHGYTNGVLGAGVEHRDIGGGNEAYAITIDQADSKSTITTNLTAATLATTLTVVTASQTVTPDGVDTVTFDLDGEANASVILSWAGSEVVDKAALTLNGTGDGSFVVGPYAAGTCTDDSGFTIVCNYTTNIAAGVTCTVIVQ